MCSQKNPGEVLPLKQIFGMLYLEHFTFNPFSENTYLLYNEQREAFLIDPGNFSEDETAQIQKLIAEKGLTVKSILLTHAHIDHVLGLQHAYDTYQVPVLLHPLEKEILDRNPLDANRFGFFFPPFKGELQFIKEKEKLYLGKDVLEIYHVPGHSPGSLAFHNPAQNFIISGDALFRGSIGRTDLYKGDAAQLLSSISEKLFTLPSETVVHSGHGEPTTVGFEKEHNPFFR